MNFNFFNFPALKAKPDAKKQIFQPKIFELKGLFPKKYWTLKKQILLVFSILLTLLVIVICLVFTLKVVNKCSNITCLNYGACKLKVKEPICECLPQYYGQYCQHYNNCWVNKCFNNAKCINTLNGYKCDCLSGYNGSNCEYYNSCWDFPCEGCQRISSQSQQFLCTCSKYSEKKCSSEIIQPLGIATSIVSLPNGEGLIGGFDDFTIRVSFDLTFRNYSILRGHSNLINSLKMVTNDLLASASKDGTIKLWNITDLSFIRTLYVNDTFAINLDLIPIKFEDDGEARYLTLITDDGRLKVWGLDTIKLDEEKILTSSYSNDLLYIAAGTNKGKILRKYVNSRLRYVYSGIDRIFAIAVLKDDNIVTGSSEVKIWNSTSLEYIASLTDHSNIVVSLKTLPNGYLASGSFDTTIKIWNTSTLECIATLYGHTDAVSALEILQNRNIVSGSWDNTIRIWDSITYKCIYTINSNSYIVSSLVILKNGNIVSGSDDSKIKIWNSTTFELVSNLDGHTKIITGLELLPNGNLVSASADRSTRLWNTTSFNLIANVTEAFEITCLKMLNNGNIAIGFNKLKNYNIIIRNYTTLEDIVTLYGHPDPILYLEALKNGNLVSFSYNAVFKLWNLITFECILTLSAENNVVSALKTLQNGNIVAGFLNSQIRIWNSTTFKRVATLTGHNNSVFSLALLQNGYLASGSDDTKIKIWNTVTFECIATLDSHTGYITALEVLKNGNLVSASTDKSIRIWNATTFNQVAYLTITSNPWSLTILKEGNIASGFDSFIKIINATSLDFIKTLNGHKGKILSLVTLQNGNLVSGCADQLIKIWKAYTFELIATLNGHYGGIISLVALKNGNIASSSADTSIKIWNTTTLKCIATLNGHSDTVMALSVLENGNIVSGSQDQSIYLWSYDLLNFFPLYLQSVQIDTSSINTITFFKYYLVCGLSNSLIYVLYSYDLSVVGKFSGHSQAVTSLLNVNNLYFLSFSDDKFTLVWAPTLLGVFNYQQGKVLGNGLVKDKIAISSTDTTIGIWTGSTLLTKRSEIKGHKKMVNKIIEFIDSKSLTYLVTTSDDFTLKIWFDIISAFNFINIQTLIGHTDYVYDLIAVSSNLLASCSKDRSIIIWNLTNVDTPKIAYKLHAHLKAVICLVHFKEKNLLISGSSDYTIRIWNFSNSFRSSQVLLGHTGAINSLIIFQSKYLISGSNDGTIRAWNSLNFKLERVFYQSNQINSLICNNEYFISASNDGFISVYGNKYKLAASLFGHDYTVYALAKLLNGNLVSGASDATIKVWNLTSNACITTFFNLYGHTDSITSLKVLKNGNIASASFDAAIKIWNSITFRLITTLYDVDSIYCLELLKNGNLISGSNDKTIKIWNSTTYRYITTLRGHSKGVYSLAILGNGNIVSGSFDFTIKIWNSTTFANIATLLGHYGVVTALTILPNGNIISGSVDKTIKIWNSTTFKCVDTLWNHKGTILSLEILENGNIVSSSIDNTIKIWDSNKLECLSTINDNFTVSVWNMELLQSDRLAISSNNLIFIISLSDPLDLLYNIPAEGLSNLNLKDNFLIGSMNSKSINIWHIFNGELEFVSSTNVQNASIHSVSVLNSFYIISVLSNKSILIWDFYYFSPVYTIF